MPALAYIKLLLNNKTKIQFMTSPVLVRFCSLLILFSLASCQTRKTADKETIRAEIDKILKIQEDAYDQNTESGRNILAQTCDDSLIFIGGDDGGLVQSASSYVHDLADGYSKKPASRTYRIFDNTVIVTSLQQTFKLFNKDSIFFNSRYTKVFVKSNGKWKMVYVSYAPLPIQYYKPANISSNLLNEYSGLYQNSETSTDTISVHDNRLYIGQRKNSGSELIPLNDSTFIGDGYFGYTVFSKNQSGAVTHMYYQYPDGQKIFSSKIK